ncbi:2OG-Fe(II) oxygenase family protein [Ceratobasidium sp. AG-Ba]|nr:2OG-Fe(II) oxygenase family protein [Ceratobasidium sp. AG-Ba]
MSLAYIRSHLPGFLAGPSSSSLIPEPPQADPEDPNALPPIVAHRLDFVELGLPEYENKFAMVIDNLFTPEDCARYVAAAEASKQWEVAAINGGQDLQYVDTTYRNSSRIMLDDHALCGEILEKLRPYLKDIEYMGNSPLHRTYSRDTKTANEPPARLAALNERLRFLKYGPGQFFRNHCDGIYFTPDRKQVSYYTLQLYLNGSPEELQGGATRFWKSGNVEGPDRRKAEPGQTLRKFIDVEPRTGRALIFEQRGLVHSGEDVKKGIKITVRTDLMYEVCPVLET